MTAGCHAHQRQTLGAYVLGALDPTERAEVEAHLAQCAACREELAELAGLPGLLGRLSAEEASATAPAPSATLLERLLVRMHAARRREHRRRSVLALIATAVVLVAGAGIRLATHAARPPAAPPAAALVGHNPASGAAAAIGLRSRPWGTAMTVRLRGVPRGEHCTLVAVAGDGHREIAATWTVVYAEHEPIPAATAIARRDLGALTILGTHGHPLVTVRTR